MLLGPRKAAFVGDALRIGALEGTTRRPARFPHLQCRRGRTPLILAPAATSCGAPALPHSDRAVLLGGHGRLSQEWARAKGSRQHVEWISAPTATPCQARGRSARPPPAIERLGRCALVLDPAEGCVHHVQSPVLATVDHDHLGTVVEQCLDVGPLNPRFVIDAVSSQPQSRPPPRPQSLRRGRCRRRSLRSLVRAP